MAARQLRVLSTIMPLADGAIGIATHPEDDLVLATVLNAHVEYFVTGDRQLQKPETIGGTPIVSPAVFLAMLDGTFPG